MSDGNPYKQLGIEENASFEEIQEAKTRLYQQYQNDTKVLESIEMAYDAIIMHRLKMRQEGKIKVPEGIRFPEKTIPTPINKNTRLTTPTPQWLKEWIDTPSNSDILQAGGVFLLLAILTIFNDVNLVVYFISFGFFANLYFLVRKEQRFWRGILITLVGLILGILLGSQIPSFANSINSNLNLEVNRISAYVTFCIFWLISSFIR